MMWKHEPFTHSLHHGRVPPHLFSLTKTKPLSLYTPLQARPLCRPRRHQIVRSHFDQVPLARLHLWAVASLEVVLHANHWFQRLKPLVELVPFASFKRTRESRCAPLRNGLWRLCHRLHRLELFSVRAHVHAEVWVAQEAFLVEVQVLGEDFYGVELHYFATIVEVFDAAIIVVFERPKFGIEYLLRFIGDFSGCMASQQPYAVPWSASFFREKQHRYKLRSSDQFHQSLVAREVQGSYGFVLAPSSACCREGNCQVPYWRCENFQNYSLYLR